jgi:diguanylate cyclase (GGDEF)-like protein
MSGPLPENEQKRLELLRNLGILDTPAEERFDRITRFANLLLGTPISLISLIDSDRQWFKSAQGLEAKETSRNDAFCAHAIIEQKTFFVEDATKDDRFRNNPLVTGDPHIRMYAGHPIELENGLRIGTLCVIDKKPRALAPSELEILSHLAAWVKAEIANIELEKTVRFYDAQAEHNEKKSEKHEKLYDFFNNLNLIDAELVLPNSLYLQLYLSQEISRLKYSEGRIAVMAIAVDVFADYEKAQGSAVAIASLRRIAKCLADYPKWPRGMTFRFGRERFIIVLPEKTRDQAVEIATFLRTEIHNLRIQYGKDLLTLSYGICSIPAASSITEKLVAKAVEALETGQKQGTDKIRYADTFEEKL